MFGFIRRWLWNRRRSIFRFYDGERVRAADPIAVAMALRDHPEFTERHLFDAAKGDELALAVVAKTAQTVFRVNSLSGSGRGLTISELLELMLAFDAYCLTLKKSTDTSPTSPPSTESTSPPSNEPTTNDSSASG
jgi:hypothetical protein